jgi:hypothetical protein
MICSLVWIGTTCGAQEALPLLPHEVEEQKMPADRPLEVAFCLDVSGSMISQQRSAVQWILNRTHTWMAKRPVRAALILYYDDDLFSVFDFENGDGALIKGFQAPIGGVWGSELTGKYAALAANRLSWTPGKGAQSRVEKRIIMVGNEAMIAGSSDYRVVVPRLREQGWRLDAVEGRSRSNWTVWIEPDMNQWKHFALLGGGRYETFALPGTPPISRGRSAPDLTPFDAQIRELNSQYNHTLMPYGLQGSKEAHKLGQMEQELDETGALFVWISQKINQTFPKWEFVDAVLSKTVTLENVQNALLPALWRGLKPDELGKEIVKIRDLRLKYANLLRLALQQRSNFLAQAQQNEINLARERFRNAFPMPQPVAKPTDLHNPAVSDSKEGLTNTIGDRGNKALSSQQSPTSTLPSIANVHERGAVAMPSAAAPTPEQTVATLETGTATAPPHTLSNFDDEFTSPSTLTRWKQWPGGSADGVSIDAVHNELVLRSGAVSKSIEGDFAVTIRVRVAPTKVEADSKEPHFQFVLRALNPELTDDTTPQKVGWQASADGKWKPFCMLPGSTQDNLPALTKVDEKASLLLRLARMGARVFVLSQDAEQTWKIDFQTEVQWPDVVQVMLESKAEKAKDISVAPLPAHIDWVHFDRISSAHEAAAPNVAAAEDERWLQRLGHRLDTRK